MAEKLQVKLQMTEPIQVLVPPTVIAIRRERGQVANCFTHRAVLQSVSEQVGISVENLKLVNYNGNPNPVTDLDQQIDSRYLHYYQFRVTVDKDIFLKKKEPPVTGT